MGNTRVQNIFNITNNVSNIICIFREQAIIEDKKETEENEESVSEDSNVSTEIGEFESFGIEHFVAFIG